MNTNTKKILVINSGSSSIKFKLYEDKKAVASGVIEKIGEHTSKIELKDLISDKVEKRDEPVPNHQAGINVISEFFQDSGILESLEDLDGCGHRVVHGGKNLTEPCLIDTNILKEIRRVGVIAPLHNPAHLVGIKAMISAAPEVPNVAVFDTAFHSSMPNYAYMYALPYEFYEKEGIRKYGFHGTSHSYVSKKAAEFLGIDYDKFNAISAHLGNGASICAIENGRSVDTSMGFTPLEGLMMGTRCGDIDPAIISHLARISDYNTEELDAIMNKRSGFLGVCGYNDLRDVDTQIQSGNEKAKLALDMYIYRLAKYIGSYFSILPRTDALIFTAGVGENSDLVRKLVCNKLSHLGFDIDEGINEGLRGKLSLISKESSKVKILIVPTDEELEIANITTSLINNA
ncbi:acetate kinase [Campylobacter sp. MIT 99-7217]|uniref:acetate kinase n=1 Tax=Campylobacter sp. MIT 99-7217 TaxID=535091 RepID=UPI00115B7B49|nr:acetate kinase [Campylobacter sp. MIT 99-7217]TQR33158.1 acetate kinase [Campylobacter sp. MIT 99-7217]